MLIITSLLISSTGYSNISKNKQDNIAIGVGAGLLSGIGFIFRSYSPNNSNAHHFGGIVYGQKNNFEINLSYQRLNLISKFEESKLYFFVGGSTFYSYSKNDYYTQLPDKLGNIPSRETETVDKIVNLGIGLSFEYGGNKGLNYIFELPLSLQMSLDNSNNDFRIYPIPSVILQYRI